MSYEDKVIPGMTSSPPKTPPPGSPCSTRSIGITSNNDPPHTSHEPVAIFWDIENCPVPSDVRPEDVAGNIRLALRIHPIINGAVTQFSAYGDFNIFPRRLREGCQRTGVKLVDVPNGRKDAADKAILVDMFLFALDNRPPSSIVLISGDVDFAPALHILGQRGYTIILIIPCHVSVASALMNAGRFVWDWPSVARGEGFVPPKTYGFRGPDLAGHLTGYSFRDNADTLNEEESIVYRGVSVPEYGVPSLRSQSLPSGLGEAPMGDQSGCQDRWVQPGDIQRLKGELVKLCEMSGGMLPFARIPSEYSKSFGRPLYMAEYGVYKLVNLIKKLEDTFIVVGQGPKKTLCLRKKCPSSPCIAQKDQKRKGIVVDNEGSYSSEDLSDDERNAGDFDDQHRYDSFRTEVQELLMCYAYHPVLLSVFESLYEQRYKKGLNYQNFGVDGLEELIEKVKDVVVLCEDQESKKKFLVSTHGSG